MCLHRVVHDICMLFVMFCRALILFFLILFLLMIFWLVSDVIYYLCYDRKKISDNLHFLYT